MSANTVETKWVVRRRNTARLTVFYQQLDGALIPLTGCSATFTVYNGDNVVLQLNSTGGQLTITPASARIDVLLLENDILSFDFEQGEYELIVFFPNGDKSTFVDGPLIVRNGVGPFE